MTEQLKPHPIAELLPGMRSEEWVSFRADIAANGMHVPIVLFEGMILDGRHRERACRETGKPMTFKEFEGGFHEAAAFVESMNARRRHCSESQLAMFAAGLANMRRGRPQLNPSAEGIISQSAAAHMVGVSVASVERAVKVQKDGIPEVAEAVTRGDVSVTAAAEFVAVTPKEKQRKIFAKANNKIASLADRIKVESAFKHARRSFDLCLIDNANVPKTKTNIIAMLHFLALKLDGDGNSEAREGARYIRRMIEEWEETDAINEYHDLESGVFEAIRHCPQEFKVLQDLLCVTKDELEFTLKQLTDYGHIELAFQEGKTEDARGQKKKLWKLTAKGLAQADRIKETYAVAA